MTERLTVFRIAAIALSLCSGTVLLYLRSRVRLPDSGVPDKGIKQKRLTMLIFGILGFWLACGLIFGIFSEPSEGLQVQMTALRINLFGFSVSSSVVIGWIAMLMVIIPAIFIRIFVIPKFKENPKGIQNVLEFMVDFISGYVREKSNVKSEPLNAYMMTLALYITACGVTELFSFRPPTSDLTTTFSLALVTFTLINYYGIKHKGVAGRIKSFAKPTSIVFPFRLLSDLAIPVSLACRLFGNMLGGMILLHMIYSALGAFGVGIPAVLGLYFNVFHPLIQVFIFITLSLTFIGEAVE